jgi:hypothetical protein
MDAKKLEIRAILHKLSGGAKRKREDLSNPLVAYCRALLIPHFKAGTKPDIPFDVIQDNVYNVEGNPPHKMLQVHKDFFEFI